MNYLSIQHIFTTVVLHLRNQGEPALANDNLCRYRNGIGHSCAAGCLIKDSLYDPNIENKSVIDSEVYDALDASGINMNDADIAGLMKELQVAHDSTRSHDWLNEQEARWQSLARSFHLVVPPIHLTSI
jgi:hypothetical protein